MPNAHDDAYGDVDAASVAVDVLANPAPVKADPHPGDVADGSVYELPDKSLYGDDLADRLQFGRDCSATPSPHIIRGLICADCRRGATFYGPSADLPTGPWRCDWCPPPQATSGVNSTGSTPPSGADDRRTDGREAGSRR